MLHFLGLEACSGNTISDIFEQGEKLLKVSFKNAWLKYSIVIHEDLVMRRFIHFFLPHILLPLIQEQMSVTSILVKPCISVMQPNFSGTD